MFCWNKDAQGDGVIVGCDVNYEWALDWWVKNYTKHNSFPICFANFGMTPQTLNWCKNIGRVIDCNHYTKKTWFKKPMALLASPFKRSIWFDLDCEIRGYISPIFDYIKDDKIAVTEDPFAKSRCKNNRPIATGVVGVAHGNPLVVQWASRCAAGDLRGDQEVLNAFVDANSSKIELMPMEYQWLRLLGDDPKAVVMHWTGENGNKIIKDMIKNGK